jgi:hypothetical protein
MIVPASLSSNSVRLRKSLDLITHSSILFHCFLDWLFPNGTTIDDLQVCGPEELKLFCKDYVEVAEVSFILSTVASFVVSLALVHYLMCLASNYAYIRDQEKISDLQEMQYLHESIMK